MITIGVLGGGQLARMLALAAYPIGMQVHCYEPCANTCATDVCPVTIGNYEDYDKLLQWATQCDVITLENENIPLTSAKAIEQHCTLAPGSKALSYSQDRLLEKQLCQQLTIKTPDFFAINSNDELSCVAEKLSYPFIIKTRRLGYDGKGQYRINNHADLEALKQQWPNNKLIAEQFIPFEREVSLIAVKSNTETRFYPLTENHHQQGILRYSNAPFVDEGLTAQAHKIADTLLKHLDYVGILAIEFFVQQGELILNELAPRVHNSGHWTLDAAITSQFENHLRAITQLPLGACDAITHSTMVNCIGQFPSQNQLMQSSTAKVHNYQKQARAHRKVGHVNLLATKEINYQQEVKNLIKLCEKID